MQHSHTTNGGEGRFGAPKQSDVSTCIVPVRFMSLHGMVPLNWLLSNVATSFGTCIVEIPIDDGVSTMVYGDQSICACEREREWGRIGIGS